MNMFEGTLYKRAAGGFTLVAEYSQPVDGRRIKLFTDIDDFEGEKGYINACLTHMATYDTRTAFTPALSCKITDEIPNMLFGIKTISKDSPHEWVLSKVFDGNYVKVFTNDIARIALHDKSIYFQCNGKLSPELLWFIYHEMEEAFEATDPQNTEYNLRAMFY